VKTGFRICFSKFDLCHYAEDLLRLSVGLEDPEDLFQDLNRALDAKKHKAWEKKRKAEHLASGSTLSGAVGLCRLNQVDP
jgi:hypothetical protein